MYSRLNISDCRFADLKHRARSASNAAWASSYRRLASPARLRRSSISRHLPSSMAPRLPKLQASSLQQPCAIPRLISILRDATATDGVGGGGISSSSSFIVPSHLAPVSSPFSLGLTPTAAPQNPGGLLPRMSIHRLLLQVPPSQTAHSQQSHPCRA